MPCTPTSTSSLDEPPLGGSPARHILVVEDDTGIRELIAQVLQDEGYLVEQAADGRQGLMHLQVCQPDLIVLDLMMPVMDGPAFAQACPARSTGDPIPIIAMSARADLLHAAEQLRPYGVYATLSKPFDLDTLVATVAGLVGRPRAEWHGRAS